MALINVDPRHPDPTIIAQAAAVLRDGGLVAFPTETVYGLGANALDAKAVARIFEAKARPAWNPVIAHVDSIDDARAITSAWPPIATVLAETFWPGPLTIVLPKHPSVPDALTAGLPAVAVRLPNHPVARALIAALGAPVAAPSANRFTELSPTTAEHVLESLGDRVDMILDGGSSDVGIESTVVDLTGETPRLLRPGIIGRDALERATGVAFASAAESVRDNTPRHSPGMVDRHYSPRADVWLFDADNVDELRHSLQRSADKNPDARRTAVLLLDWSLELPGQVHTVHMPGDALAYARSLYATLHTLDSEGYAIIAIQRPPQTDSWAGVTDRLTRAAHT
jgi:L-threonylcarbamoyladenylate synthase